jgi:beta-mannanase
LVVIMALAGLGVSSAEGAGTEKRLRFGVTTPGGPKASAEIAEVTRLAGESPTIEMWYSDFARPVPLAALDAVTGRGAMPVITWEPWLWGHGTAQPEYALTRIAAGEHDPYLREWAKGLRDWGRPVTLRFAHEMNGNWYPWAQGVNGNRPGDYVRAWRHVHDIMTSMGATNVTWMWSPNVPYPGSVPLQELYPGASYVDTVALDGYNWGTSQPWSAWTTPQVLFGQGLSQLRALAPDKPIVIAETGTTATGGSKAGWITGVVSYLATQPNVTGFVWFQHLKETDWRLNSTPSSAAAFANALAKRR